MNKVTSLAIFASGNGTNAQTIIEFFKGNENVSVSLLVSNNPKAGVIQRADKLSVPSEIISSTQAKDADFLIGLLKAREIDYVILAGYLKLIPAEFCKAFDKKIINIHPALLPKYGGKGMYGMNVHRAVIQNKEKESGITIHLVNENYDDGEILLQKPLKVEPNWSPEDLASAIHGLEHKYFPKTIAKYIE